MQPFFSLIIVCYNAKDLIEKTLSSILAQKFQDYEIVIIDGQSTDGTVEIISRFFLEYPQKILFLSEKDRGIYDAMNKGLERSRGQFVFFINAGDLLWDSCVLERLSLFIQKENPDFIIGDVVVYRDSGYQKKIACPDRFSPFFMRYGMDVCHQGVLVSRNIAPRYFLEYGLVADRLWVFESYARAIHPKIFKESPISLYLLGGISDRKIYLAIFQNMKMNYRRWGLLSVIAGIPHWSWLLIKFWLKTIMASIKRR